MGAKGQKNLGRGELSESHLENGGGQGTDSERKKEDHRDNKRRVKISLVRGREKQKKAEPKVPRGLPEKDGLTTPCRSRKRRDEEEERGWRELFWLEGTLLLLEERRESTRGKDHLNCPGEERTSG